MGSPIGSEAPETIVLDTPSSVSSTSHPKVIGIEDAEEKKEDLRTSLNPLLRVDDKIMGKSKGKLRSTYDSATLNSAIGLIDLKVLCKSFAHAVRQHILFAHGKKTFFELQKSGNARFSYKLGKMLDISLPNERIPVDVARSKSILSESLTWMTGTQVKPEMLESYLTLKNTDDLDLAYTESHMGEIFGKDKTAISKAFMRTFRNSLASIKSSNAPKNVLMRSQNCERVDIRGLADINKLLDAYKKNNGILEAGKEGIDDFEREETVDLGSVDLTKSYTAPKTLETGLGAAKASAQSASKNPVARRKESVSIQDENLKEFAVFQLNYDFDTKQFIDLGKIPEEYLEVPAEREIYKFSKKVLVYSRMEKEIPIIALIYIEKLVMRTGLLMNELNWRRFIFIALVIGSKIWDDESFENIHFHKVFPDVSLLEINDLERIYLKFLDYRLQISGSEYAKYYFILRTIAAKTNADFSLKPVPINKVLELQKNARKIEGDVKATQELLRKTH
eukprot:TRINITY_DN5977_c0_g10_i1.p1 TRINITY_DN5977_c0_g10~~TRINITY_DN5977_c0_g10_i1.p1  ORF type:complete len:506 (+),score=118.78 TRINITY_DN5977_c0_g10_i1:654-2171(+)